jgi:hypothetical protein
MHQPAKRHQGPIFAATWEPMLLPLFCSAAHFGARRMMFVRRLDVRFPAPPMYDEGQGLVAAVVHTSRWSCDADMRPQIR